MISRAAFHLSIAHASFFMADNNVRPVIYFVYVRSISFLPLRSFHSTALHSSSFIISREISIFGLAFEQAVYVLVVSNSGQFRRISLRLVVCHLSCGSLACFCQYTHFLLIYDFPSRSTISRSRTLLTCVRRKEINHLGFSPRATH